MSGAAPLFLVFRPLAETADPAWWQRRLDRQRSHVLAILPDGPARSMAVDHQGSVMTIEPMDMDAETAARGLMWAWNAEALRVLVVPPPVKRRWLRPPMTCVEAAKALLGLHDWRIWTPRQLRRAVIRIGARPVSPWPAPPSISIEPRES